MNEKKCEYCTVEGQRQKSLNSGRDHIRMKLGDKTKNRKLKSIRLIVTQNNGGRELTSSFPINYCPMCGGKLELESEAQ
jgi:hypothetical protein